METTTTAFRRSETLAITIPALSRPTLDSLRKNYSFVKSIKHDASPTEAVTLNLGTVLGSEENSISGDEYESRITSLPTLGYSQAAWLVENQDKFPELVALLGKVYIDFPATVVLNSDGDRCIPCLHQVGRRLDLHWYWIGRDFYPIGRVAIQAK